MLSIQLATSLSHKPKSATLSTPTSPQSTLLNPRHHSTSLATSPLFISSLSNPILISDILTATAHSKKNFAPGADGIPYCLYSQCPLLQMLLMKVIQAAIFSGRFPTSWGHTLIRPILKPGKNPFLPASYRPIALLCTDYKIFTTIISLRMKPFLPELS